MTTILSIQSSVAYGHAGNSAAVFPMMRRGMEVWPVITVHFSNNTSYGSWRGPLLPASDISEVITGIDERGVLDRVDAVLSGYQGAEDVGATVLEAADLVKQRNPKAIYCCDPVMGDVGRGFYVRPGIPEFMRDRVVPRAQVVTPNQWELNFLTGHDETATLDAVLAAADELRARGPEVVMVTSVVHDRAEAGTLDMVAVNERGAWLVTTPLLERVFTGSGDLTTAMFLTSLLADTAGADVGSLDLSRALGETAAIVFGVLKETAESGEKELQLVRAQGEIGSPSNHFEVRKIR